MPIKGARLALAKSVANIASYGDHDNELQSPHPRPPRPGAGETLGLLRFSKQQLATDILAFTVTPMGTAKGVTTVFPAYSDTLGTREKCHCKQVSL